MMAFHDTNASARRYLPPAVAVSTVAFALTPPRGATVGFDSRSTSMIWLPLVRRTRAPFLGQWALPGGPTEWNETLTDTALRTLTSAVHGAPGYLEQLYSFGSVERSADAQRLVTIAYWALYGERDAVAEEPEPEPEPEPEAVAPAPTTAPGSTDLPGAPTMRWDDPEPRVAPAPAASPAQVQRDEQPPTTAELRGAGSPNDNVAWFSADNLPPLAFDHLEIVEYALARLRAKTEYSAVAHRFLGETFTLAQLRLVHEAVRGEAVDPANFRRNMLAQGTLVDTGEVEAGAPHRPARLYRFRDDAHDSGRAPGGEGEGLASPCTTAEPTAAEATTAEPTSKVGSTS